MDQHFLVVLFSDGQSAFIYTADPWVCDTLGPRVSGTDGTFPLFTRDGPVTSYEHMCMLPAGSLLHFNEFTHTQ